MARKITDYNGQITAPDSDYPDGRIKDSTGFNDGTFYDEKAYGDIQQFFMKLLRRAEITANGNPENETNGFQFMAAAKKIFSINIHRFFLNSTDAPIIFTHNNPIVEATATTNTAAFNETVNELIDSTITTIINRGSGNFTISCDTGDTFSTGGTSLVISTNSGKQILLCKPLNKWIVINSFSL